MKRISGIFFLLFAVGLSAQNVDLRKFDYRKADSVALFYTKVRFKTYSDAAGVLTAKLPSQQEKFRAIYRWIAENIKYSYNKTNDASLVFRTKRAACEGYASLLEQMCEAANLQCEVIKGWSKIEQGDIGQKMILPSHAWNAINLNGKWYLTDITWATSYFDPVTKRFVKYFDTAYFLPYPKSFIRQHYPMNKKWQLLDTVAHKKAFKKAYVSYDGMDEYGIKIISPACGECSQNSRKEFEMVVKFDKPVKSTDSVDNFYCMVDYTKRQPDVNFSYTINEKGQLDMKLKFPDNMKGEHRLTLYYNGEQIAGYMVKFY